ncbi:MAG: ABC transporter permease [Deltaproteobacteria bacterium]|nr:ABC transporter permease [Deltaproteobacteria bacterium]MBM4323290.1 ABC transporter permease [Deltaproteobacteria bacterium]
MSLLNFQRMLVQIGAFAFKNWIITKRNFFSLSEILFWPLVGLFSVGLLTVFLQLDESMTGFILIGVMSMSLIQVCQIDVAYALLYDLWAKSMKHTFIAPIRPFQLISGAWLIGMARSSLVFLLLSIFSGIAFGFNFFQSGAISLILYLLGLFLIAVSIGIGVCILVLLFGYKAEVAAWSITSLMALICGIYYPISILPSPLPEIARAIPLTYFLEYFRSFYGFEGRINSLLLRGFGLIGLYLIIEAVLLRWVIHHARKNGTFIKLSE